jgi:rod shape-determining protein MreC
VADDKTIRRRRAVFLLLVVVTLFLLIGSFLGAFGGAQTGVAGVVAPLQNVASKAVKPFRDLTNWVGDTARAKGQLKKVTNQRNQLLFTGSALAGQVRRDGEAQKLAAITTASNLTSYGPVKATVTAQSLVAWYRNVRIDKGSGARVAVGDPVIAPDGVAGRVVSVNSGSSVVRLITDPASGVTARVITSPAVANLTGSLASSQVGDANDLILRDVPSSTLINVGDVVTTAGTSTDLTLPSYFPPDLPLGTVSAVHDGGSETQEVHVRPYASLRGLENVLVLTAVPGGK